MLVFLSEQLTTLRGQSSLAARAIAPLALAFFAVAAPLSAQTISRGEISLNAPANSAGSRPASSLDELVATAQVTHPTIRAASARVAAARARVGPAGLLPDPLLSLGIVNLPISKEPMEAPGGHGTPAAEPEPEMMTMKMIGIGQMLPYPGKLSLSRRAAERELTAAQIGVEAARLDVAREVKDAYYELAYLERALEVVENNRKLLVNFIGVTETRYSVGVGGQQDVLKARVEASRLAEDAATLHEQRRATQARLNAALARPTTAPIDVAVIPERIERAAVAAQARDVRFVSAAFGARAAGSALPALAELQELAVTNKPEIREHLERIAAQETRVELARKAHLPDFDVSLQYGQRSQLPDMVTAMVSIPLPIQKRKRQNLAVSEAQAEAAMLHAEHQAEVLVTQREVARLYAELERIRTQLALFKKAIVPQGRASLEAAAASFQVGRVDFLTLLENQTTLFNYETAYHRLLTEFAQRLTELERMVGKEVV